MKKLFLFIVLSLLLVIPVLGGCSPPKAATEVADAYYQEIKNNDFDAAVEYFSDKFFETTPQSDLMTNLSKVNTKFGDLKSYKLVGWNTTKWMGTGELESGTYYKLQYEVEYSKYPARETLTLFKPAIGGEILIYGFNISSEGFLD